MKQSITLFSLLRHTCLLVIVISGLATITGTGGSGGDGDNSTNDDDNSITYTYYRDWDADGFGNPEIYTKTASQPQGYVANNDDCNDYDASINPSVAEICPDNLDNDCDGQIDEDCPACTDADEDGYFAQEDCGTAVDCDDDDASINLNAMEICDGIDNNCDGQIDEGCSSGTDGDENGDSQGDCSIMGDYCRYGDNGHMTWATPTGLPTINQSPIINNMGLDGAFLNDGFDGQLLEQYPGCPVVFNICDCPDTSEFIPGAEISVRMKILVNGAEGDNGVYFNEPYNGYVAISSVNNFLYNPTCVNSSGLPASILQTDLATNPIVTDDLSFAYFCDSDGQGDLDAVEPAWRLVSAPAWAVNYYYWNGSGYVETTPVFGINCTRTADTGERVTMIAAERLVSLLDIDEEKGMCMWAMDVPAVIVTPVFNECTTFSVQIELMTDMGCAICSDATVECVCIYDMYTICCRQLTRQIVCPLCEPDSL